MTVLTDVRGMLIDLDGVLYVDSKIINGAIETINKLKKNRIECRFITNTSTLSQHSLHKKLQNLGFSIKQNEIISATQAALLYVQQFPASKSLLLLADDVKQDFQTVKQSSNKADFVIVGDIGNQWSYDLMNTAFSLLQQGAQLIAIHKNRYWQTTQGLQMDIGGFVTALEYASQSEAIVIGKPSINFFQMAIQSLKLQPHQVAIIGDDIDSDINGGQNAGLSGILVQTGKYRKQIVDASGIQAKHTIKSIIELPALLGLD